jgi:putative PIN family toxin of toxin-antitoxin system
MPRAVIDTSVWVSALLNSRGFPAQVLEALKADQFQLILSKALIEELVDVLSRPRIVKKYGLQPEDVAEFVALLEAKALFVDPPGELHVCRDPHDDIVLETALLGKADYLVSRDDDLKRDLELTRVMHAHGVALVSVNRFLNVLVAVRPAEEE